MTERKQKKDDARRRAQPAQPEAPSTGAEAAVAETPAGEVPIGEPPAGETSIVETPAGETPVARGDELARAVAERDEYLDHLRRLKAEFENYRKRVQRDNEDLRLRAAEAVVESLLPVMDNMGRALEAAAQHEEGQLVAGVELVSGQLRRTLEGHGLEEIPVETGTLFDPNLHEAIMTQASEKHEEGTVLQVLERGYLLHGRLLRPAKVIVSR